MKQRRRQASAVFLCPESTKIPVTPGSHAIFLFKRILEIITAGEAAAQGNLRDGIGGGNQLLGGTLQADEHDVFMQADAGSSAEFAAQIVGAESRGPGHVAAGDRLGNNSEQGKYAADSSKSVLADNIHNLRSCGDVLRSHFNVSSSIEEIA